MALQVLRDMKIWLGGYEIASDCNEVQIEFGCDSKEITVFNDTTRKFRAGLLNVQASAKGLQQFGTAPQLIGTTLEAYKNTADIPLTIAPNTAAAGSLCHFMKALINSQKPGAAAVGDFVSFEFAGVGSGDPLIQGILLENGTTARTATGNGASQLHVAVGATQRLWAALHVVAAAGTTPTLDVVVQSDDAGGFASPTARITLAQKNAIGYAVGSTAIGAITDTYYRAIWTIGGTGGPSFTFAVAIGVF